MTPYDIYQRQFTSARINLLLMSVLTIANIAAYWFELGFMLPFSAFLPFTIFDFGYFFSIEWAEPSLFIYGIVFASLILIFYFLGYFLSKHKPAWLTFVLAMYIVDTLIMVYLFTSVFYFNGTMILDILFHIWVLYYFVMGVRAAKKLKQLQAESSVLE